jgi:hypothetical protein
MPASTSDLHAVRRANLARLLQEFAAKKIAAGDSAKGIERAFAEQLQVAKSLLSQLKTSRNISDVMAAQIEARCKVKKGWLSIAHDGQAKLALGEADFITLARAAYRNQDAAGRQALVDAITRITT